MLGEVATLEPLESGDGELARRVDRYTKYGVWAMGRGVSFVTSLLMVFMLLSIERSQVLDRLKLTRQGSLLSVQSDKDTLGTELPRTEVSCVRIARTVCEGNSQGTEGVSLKPQAASHEPGCCPCAKALTAHGHKWGQLSPLLSPLSLTSSLSPFDPLTSPRLPDFVWRWPHRNSQYSLS